MNLIHIRCLPLLLLVTLVRPASGAERTLAVTFDDLPVAQSGAGACDFSALPSFTEKLLRPFREQTIPLTAFVVSGNCPSLTLEQRRSVLRMWLEADAELGNHSHSHRSLNNTPLEEYQEDILRAEAELQAAVGPITLRYFRSPGLHTGATPEAKQGLDQFLKAHGYVQAPVTIDNSEWVFATVYGAAMTRGDDELAEKVRNAYIPYMESVVAFFEERTAEVVGREIPQVLLVHANSLNADVAPELIAMFQRRGYQFVSMEEALRNPAFRLPDTYVGKVGLSWIHRLAITKGVPLKNEPEAPGWIMKELGN